MPWISSKAVNWIATLLFWNMHSFTLLGRKRNQHPGSTKNGSLHSALKLGHFLHPWEWIELDEWEVQGVKAFDGAQAARTPAKADYRVKAHTYGTKNEAICFSMAATIRPFNQGEWQAILIRSPECWPKRGLLEGVVVVEGHTHMCVRGGRVCRKP